MPGIRVLRPVLHPGVTIQGKHPETTVVQREDIMLGIHKVAQIPASHLGWHHHQAIKVFERLASGKRINRAADDAAGLAIAARLSAQISSQSQGMRNLHDGISLTRVAEGALGESSNLIGRMRELTIQGQNGTLTDSDRATIQQEYDALAAEMTRISASTEFNGQRLLDGSLMGSGVISIENGQGPDASMTEIEITDASAAALGVEGLSISDPDTLRRLDLALDGLSGIRASLGTMENRFVSQVAQVGQAYESGTASRSIIEDFDMVRGISDLIRIHLMEQRQLSLLAQSRWLSRKSILAILLAP
jgi:flagellin